MTRYYITLHHVTSQQEVLYPSFYLQNLQLWKELYLASPLIPYSTSSNSLTSLVVTTPIATPTTIPLENGHCHGYANGDLHREQKKEDAVKGEMGGATASINGHEGISSEGLDSSQLLWASTTLMNIEMEDSFRVLEKDFGEPSLTMGSLANQSHLAQLSQLSHLSPSHQRSMSYSLYSECESRLRSLGSDGLCREVDPLQERMKEIEGVYLSRIELLESKVKKLTLTLKSRSNSDRSLTRESEEEEQCLNLFEENNETVS